MSSTRDEILKALAEHPDGLTSRELAPMCPACECDPMIVARKVAELSGDREIHTDGLREGAVVWKAGAPVREVREAPISLAGMENQVQGRSAADHAKAIVEMRNRAPQKSAPRLPPVPAAPAPAAAHESPRNPAPQEGAPMTIKERIKAALEAHGPMTTRELKKWVKDSAASTVLAKAARETKEFVRLGGGTRSGIYGLPGQKLSDRKTETPVVPKAGRVNKAKKGGRRARRQAAQRAPRAERPATPASRNGGAHFAIDEQGAVGIEKDGEKMRLDPEEIARLRTFIDKTQDLRGA